MRTVFIATPPVVTSTIMGARRPRWVTAVEGIVMLFAVIVSLELVLGAAGIGEQEYLRLDPLTGFAPMEGKHVTWRKEGFSRTSFSNEGLRDVERSKDKPANTFRIAVLGDSLVEGLQVDLQDTFSQQMESRLNRASTRKHFEVLNFGVSCYNLGQMYLRLKHTALSFHPDVVVLPLRVGSVLALAPDTKGGFFSSRPTFLLSPGGGLIEDNTARRKWERSREGQRVKATAWLRRHSRIWGVISLGAEQFMSWWEQVARTSYPIAGNAPVTETVQKESASPDKSSDQSRNLELLTAVREDEVRQRWSLAYALISAIKKECQQAGCKLVIVRFPFACIDRIPAETELIEQAASALELPYCNLSARLGHSSDPRYAPLWCGGHFSSQGHRLIADELLSLLQREQLL